MKKSLRKVGAVVLALAMVLSLGVTAFAADNNYEGSNDFGWGVTNPNAIPLTKSIVIFNPDGVQVREPDVSYTYTVAPFDTTKADAEALTATVTDDGRYNPDAATGTPVTVTVLNGVAGSVTGTTIAFAQTNAKVDASATGVELEKTQNLTVDLTKFSRAGIYRYAISEAVTPGDVTTVGLEARETAYSATRYLDLYIGNNAAGTAFELKGAIIFKTDAVDNSSTPATTAITVTTDKTTGFEPATDPAAGGSIDYTNDDTVDRYFTYNLEVNKTTTGTLADKTNKFPFVVTLTGNLTHEIEVDVTNTGAGTIPATTKVSTTNLVLNPTLANGDKLTVTGIPKGTTVTVKETNNTPDVYTAAWDGMTGTTTADAAVKGYTSANVEKANLSLESSDYVINTTAVALNGGQTVTSGTIGGTYVKTVLGYTNTIAEISPTGVVLRVAPYALMLVAGLFLLFLGKKRQAYEA